MRWTDLSRVVKSLCPKIATRWVSLTRLLPEVGKDGRQFLFTGLLGRHVRQVALVAELGELGDAAKERIVGEDGVGEGERGSPLALREDALDHLHIFHLLIDVDRAVQAERRPYPSVNHSVVGVRNTVLYAHLCTVVVPVLICPGTVCHDGRSNGLLGH